MLADFTTMADHIRPSGGKFFGYVFGSGEPVGAISELLAAVLNQNVTAWRSAPAAVAIEQAVVGWLAEAVGCAGFTGSLCGGGSAANLMALAMAREAKLPANEDGARPGIIYASEQVHMSIPKAVALLGLGRKNLRLIPVDANFRMRMGALEAAIAQDRAAGRTPIAIVATAGTVATGAIDPLPEIAALARREGLWMHVDGAMAASPRSRRARAVRRGWLEADSLSLDARRGCTSRWIAAAACCFRDAGVARETFAHSGDYVKALNQSPGEVFALLRGIDRVVAPLPRAEAVDVAAISWPPRLPRRHRPRPRPRPAAGRQRAAHPELELLAPVPLSAVCFRHRGKDNEAILRRVIARRRVFISNATIDGGFAPAGLLRQPPHDPGGCGGDRQRGGGRGGGVEPVSAGYWLEHPSRPLRGTSG